MWCDFGGSAHCRPTGRRNFPKLYSQLFQQQKHYKSLKIVPIEYSCVALQLGEGGFRVLLLLLLFAQNKFAIPTTFCAVECEPLYLWWKHMITMAGP